MKDVLILGGSYFVGRVFLEELLRKGGYRIHVLNRGNIPIHREDVVEVVCDRHDLDRMGELLPPKEWHTVIDFCAYTREDIAGTLGVIPADRIGRYVYISTASIYEPTTDLPVGEDAPKLSGPQPELGPFADYGYNKWLAELELQTTCEKSGIPHVSIRPAFIYGKYNYAPRENYFFDLIVRDEPIVIPENGLALFSFVSVWDVARIVIACMENDSTAGQAFNASAGELVSYDRLVRVFEEVTEKRLQLERRSVEEIERLQLPLPFPLSEHLVYDGTRIQRVLDFQYTDLVRGMGETFRYYKLGRGLD
jgi:nucleoside-diphosphate-sugar epimerase